MENIEILTELANSNIATKIVSKLDGNKNWMIHTEIYDGTPRIRFAGRAGQGDIFRTCFLGEIAKYHYRWYYFTYKKDYKEALSALLTLGYEPPLW